MVSFPNCKINLGLYITNKRDDSYHNLETVFYPIPLRDVLEVVPAKSSEPELHISGKAVAGNKEDNLVWRAYKLMQKTFGERMPLLDIYLHKSLPMGAGLGGGSSDGAFMLRLLNEYCKLSLSEEQLAAYALQLGSDCPFFIYNTPQFAEGRGEQMEPVAIDLSGFSIQIICPQVHISTAKAFAMIKPQKASYNLRELANLPVVEWRDQISNDFEAAVFSQHPQLADIKQQLYNQGAIYASMSGSGSAIYGLFSKGHQATIQSDTAFERFYV
ncbi:MAG: 4-(cytidine 5'-diphospho)-2-C-methyl-D-erythritol kinase [Sphingobacteriales bacterium]|nr:MAG: 4-(cytidine 5'-diphospho)-2-C-methyl-D-erythritol kinase [Sphingobacteriales bacterium]